ncbi:glycerol-3-phosphate responsive antiterminator [Halalkalibacter kiskunsagensis]|uniref:Glycerol uptake operon antiterminator regulatory protein n=1 Tax=Halalkalibacter kiskunsagensis TaxID=1548599 RepID=A0ABV6KK88_9BACI
MSPEAKRFLMRLQKQKMIAAIKKPKQIEEAIEKSENLSGVFLLTGTITVIKQYVDQFKAIGLPAFVHVEKVRGLSNDNEGIDFIANYVRPTGIVSTKPSQIIAARKRGLVTIQRVFLIDTEIIENLQSMIDKTNPTMIEIMPARIPSLIPEIKKVTNGLPIITGGLVSSRQHAVEALDYGATALSTSECKLWKEDLRERAPLYV